MIHSYHEGKQSFNKEVNYIIYFPCAWFKKWEDRRRWVVQFLTNISCQNEYIICSMNFIWNHFFRADNDFCYCDFIIVFIDCCNNFFFKTVTGFEGFENFTSIRYINVGDRCFGLNVLVSTLRCGWRFSHFGHQNLLYFYISNGHQHSKEVIKNLCYIEIQSPTSKYRRQLLAINITMSPTSLSPFH